MPLSVKDGMGAWIKDFQDSNAPQFKGKSDKERREMAVAAYLSARDAQKESVEENVSAPRTAAHRRAMMGIPKDKPKKKPPFTPDSPKPAAKNSDQTTQSPMSRARQLAKKARDAQKVNENIKRAYEIMKPTKSMNHGIEALKKNMKIDHRTATNLAKQVMDKVKKGEFKEAVQVDELKKSTLGSYVKKASQDAGAKAYSAAQKAMSNPAQSGKDYVKSVKRQKGIARATDRLSREAKSFDQKFKDRLKFSMSKSPAVQAYMKKRKADRDADHAKQDPAAVKQNYGRGVIPPGTAYKKASKRGMKPTDAAAAVSTAFKNRSKSRKLPEETELHEAAYGTQAQRMMSPLQKARQDKEKRDRDRSGRLRSLVGRPKSEAVQYKVEVEGLPPTFMTGKSPADIMKKLRKIVKQPSMIKGVERHTDAEVKKAFRNKAQGREMDEAVIYHGNPNKDDDARNAARRKGLAKRLATADKKAYKKTNKVKLKGFGPDAAKGNMGNPIARASLRTEASVVPSKDGKKLVPMKKHSEPKSKPVPNDQFGLPRLKKEAKYPHMMYDPKTGKEVTAKTPADHNKFAKMGYTHEKPKLDEISMDLKKRYGDKAKSDVKHQGFSADIAKDMGAKDAEKHYRRKQRNRMAGITKASK